MAKVKNFKTIFPAVSVPLNDDYSKSATTSSTGGLLLALQRAMLLLAPKGGVASILTGSLTMRYFLNLLFSIPLLALLYTSVLLHRLYYQLFPRNILLPKMLYPICSVTLDACHIALMYSSLLSIP